MGAKKKITPEIECFIKEHASEYSNRQFRQWLKEEYGIECTLKYIDQYRKRNKLPKGPRSITYTQTYPYEIAKFIEGNAKGTTIEELQDMIMKAFGRSFTKQQLRSFKKNHKIRSGIDTRFKKGEHRDIYYPPKTPEALARRRKNQFKKGNMTHNHMEVGAITRSSDGYLKIKVGEPNIWEFLHRHIYEQNYGPLPEGARIVFLDCDHDNLDIDNLIALSPAEYAEYMMRLGAGTTETELSRARAYCAKINVKLREIKRK